MRGILLHIFKYLLWALLIIAALLYMSGYDIQQQAIVLLIGVVAIDIVFAVAELIWKGVVRHRKKKNSKIKAAGKKAASAGESVAGTVRETGAAIKDAAGNTWSAIKDKSTEVGHALKEKIAGSISEDRAEDK